MTHSDRPQQPRLVLFLASIGLFMAFVDLTIANIAFPDMARSFPDTTMDSLSWVLTGYSIASAAFLVPFGRLADIVGRKRVYVSALAAFTISSALCATAPSADLLVIARVAQGLSAAALVPSGLALVMAAFPVGGRLEAISISAAVGALAGGIGPAVGGALVTASDWRLVFLVNVPIGVAGVVFSARLIPESKGEAPKGFPDLAGAALFAIAIGMLVLGVVKGGEWGWDSAGIVGVFAAAVVLLIAFAVRSAGQREPLFEPALVHARRFRIATLSHAVTMGGFFGYTFCNVLFLTSVWHYSLLEAGGALTPGPIAAFAVAAATRGALERVDARVLLVPGGILWAASIASLAARAGAEPNFLGVWLPAAVLAGAGAGIVISHGASAAINAAPGGAFGAACGLQQVGRAVGAAFGIAATVEIIGTPSPIEAVTAFHDAWLFGAATLVVGAIGSLWIGATHAATLPAVPLEPAHAGSGSTGAGA
jgi:NTE family protein